MLKKDAKKLVVDRGLSKYSPAECKVLTQLIHGVRMPDPLKYQIEDRLCVTKIERLAKASFVSVRTVQYAIKKFEDDGLITVHREGVRHTYTVHVESLKNLRYYKEVVVDQQEVSRAASAKYREEIRKELHFIDCVRMPMSIERLRNGNQPPTGNYRANLMRECARASHAAVTALVQRNLAVQTA